ncbi:MAG: hypothetical protein HFG13_01540 [Oscillibacter sp.]|nr:hypothetical protein [Oscillibacter sp.]
MRKMVRNTVSLLLAMAMVFSILTMSAFAKSDKSDKTSKADKETSSVDSGFAAVTSEQAKEIALDDAGLSAGAHRKAACYISWVDHAPYAYEVKFSTREAYYHYTIGLDSGAILGSSCQPHR